MGSVEVAGDPGGRDGRLTCGPVDGAHARPTDVVVDEQELRQWLQSCRMGRTAPTPGCTVAPMVLGWQTVAISLGAALLTGSAAILTAWLNMRAQRQQQLQVRRVEAASDFSRRFIGAADAVRYAIAHPDDEPGLNNALHLTREMAPFLGPISLLFGGDSDANAGAREAFEELRHASEAAKARDRERAEKQLTASEASRDGFEAAVRDVLK